MSHGAESTQVTLHVISPRQKTAAALRLVSQL